MDKVEEVTFQLGANDILAKTDALVRRNSSGDVWIEAKTSRVGLLGITFFHPLLIEERNGL